MALEIPQLLSLGPRIRAEESRLIASTPWILRILNLGLWQRHVIVDRSSQTVTLHRRVAWLFLRTEDIPFNQIAAVTYGYEDHHPFGGWVGIHDSWDHYVVGLRVYGREEVKLFSFLGEGMVTNNSPLPDWWYWDEFRMDLTGTQACESRVFVQLLSQMMDVTITPSTLSEK
jgi:hypothetical protein